MSMKDHHDPVTLDFHDPERYEQGYLSDQQKNMAFPSPFLGTYDVQADKSIDPRLLMLLEYFRELYARKRELVKKIFPGTFHDDFAEFFRKIGGLLSQGKTQTREVNTMRRSLSLGWRRTRGVGDHEPPLRPDRFKIRTVVVDEVGQGGSGDGQGGQSGS